MSLKNFWARDLLVLGMLVLISTMMGLPNTGYASSEETYDFTVFLEDDEIGHQRWEVSQDGTHTQITIEATFDVTYAFIPFYTYRHENSERWESDCLRDIQAKTDDNGDDFFVRGQYENGQMQITTHSGPFQAKGCVKTYAYWDPNSFQDTRLLNSQTGLLDPVTIKNLGKETIAVRGVPTPTLHYQIISEKFTVDLWYTLDNDWVSLQSTTEEGRTLRYQLR